MTPPRRPDPRPQPGRRPPEYVIVLWVSPQMTARTQRPAAPRTGQPPPGPPDRAPEPEPEPEAEP